MISFWGTRTVSYFCLLSKWQNAQLFLYSQTITGHGIGGHMHMDSCVWVSYIGDIFTYNSHFARSVLKTCGLKVASPHSHSYFN